MADILNVGELVRLTLTKNGANLLEQVIKTTDELFTVQASGRVVLAANMAGFQQINLGDIDGSPAGQHLILTVDRAITIAINDTAKEVVADTLVMIGASISALFVKNTDATNTATVEFTVTD